MTSRQPQARKPASGSSGARSYAPPLAESAFARRRVEALLTGLMDQHRLVFVYASAGAGKTTAILQAAQPAPRPLVWLDLDTTDAATGRLLIYLEAALALQRSRGRRGGHIGAGRPPPARRGRGPAG